MKSEFYEADPNVRLLRETLDILARGEYRCGGERVALQLTPERRERAIYYSTGAVARLCADAQGEGTPAPWRCDCRVINTDSFQAARRLCESGAEKVLVLNFANPVSPGGGVRRGARAQEEDLCRASSLLASLESEAAKPFYEAHRAMGGTLASDAMLLSPEVEILRDSESGLLPYTDVVAVLTCAAPMLRGGWPPISPEKLRALLYRRISGMLRVAAHGGYRDLVLGAWGCGAFGNDPELVSDLFYEALKSFRPAGPGEGGFRRVVFAVLDRTPERRNLNAFVRNFEDFYRDGMDADTRQALQEIADTEAHLDSIRGSLIGGAAGDALGYPVEFMDRAHIVARYGEPGIRAYELDRASGRALISDDTQMTLFTVCGILYGETRGRLRGIGGPPSAYVYHAYQDWLTTQGGPQQHLPISWILGRRELHARRAPGNTCLSALASGKCGSTQQRINDSKGCGGVMRVAPAGLVCPRFRGAQLDDIDREGAEIAAITHGHPLGYIPAAFLTHVVHEAAFRRRPGARLRGIVEEALAATCRLYEAERDTAAFAALIRRSVEYAGNGREDWQNIHALGGGWVADEAVAIAVYCALRHEGDFSSTLIAAVNHSGDSDSTGAIAGNIAGAWIGCEAIPEEWKRNLELSDVILELADDLCHGCHMSEYGSYRDPVWLHKYAYADYRMERAH